MLTSSIRPIPTAAAGAETSLLPSAAARRRAFLLGPDVDLPATGSGAHVRPAGSTEPARSHHHRLGWQRQDGRGTAAGRLQLLRSFQDPGDWQQVREHVRKRLFEHVRRRHAQPGFQSRCLSLLSSTLSIAYAHSRHSNKYLALALITNGCRTFIYIYHVYTHKG